MVNALDFIDEASYNEAVAEEYDEIFGDGYRNEFQRSFAHAQQLIPSKDESAKIDALVAQGRFVAYSLVEVCCPFTDALIRVEHRIHSVHDTYAEANDACQFNGEFMDGMGIMMAREPEPEVYGSQPVSVLDVAEGDPYDIPF